MLRQAQQTCSRLRAFPEPVEGFQVFNLTVLKYTLAYYRLSIFLIVCFVLISIHQGFNIFDIFWLDRKNPTFTERCAID